MTITYHDLKKLQRKQSREELKRIESILHPCPKINGLDILHEHKGKKIIFSAWDGDKPANNRFTEIDRLHVLNHPGFYTKHESLMEWLAGAE